MFKFVHVTAFLLTVGCLWGQGNLLKNGDFQHGTTGWHFSKWQNVVSGKISAGDCILKMVNDSEKQLTLLEQVVILHPDCDYRLTFQMRCEEVAGNGTPQAGGGVFVLHNHQTQAYGSSAGQFRGQTGTTDWQEVELRIIKAAVERRATVYAQLRTATGTAYFRNFHLSMIPAEEVLRDASVRLQPADFQNGLMHLPADFPGALFVELKMPKVQSGEVIELALTLPKAIRCLGMSPWLAEGVNQDGTARYLSVEMQGSTPAPGFQTSRFRLPGLFCRRLLPDSVAWNNYLRIYLQAPEGTADAQAKIQIFRNGQMVGKEKTFLIKMLPRLPGDLPKLQHFKIIACYLFSLTVPIPEVRNAYLQYWRDISEKPVTFPLYNWQSLAPETRQAIDPDFQNIIFIGARGLTPLGNFMDWRQKNAQEVPLAYDRQGKEMIQACPSWVAGNPHSTLWEDYLPELVRNRLRNTNNIIGIKWDCEPGAKEYCYCETCRMAFSRSQNVELLSTEEINQRFAAQWFAWRTQQNGAGINHFAASIRRHFPEYPVILCTDPLHKEKPHVAEWCGVDVRISDHGQYDIFANMPYYSGLVYYDDLEFNLQTLRTAHMPLIDPSEAMEMYYSRYTPEKVIMNMVANAALGCKGMGFWPGDNFDGKYLHIIKATAGLIAKAEKYYFGERLNGLLQLEFRNCQETVVSEGDSRLSVFSPDFSAVSRSQLHRHSDRFLVTIFNYHPREDLIATVRLTGLVAGRNYQVRDLSSGVYYGGADPAHGFLAEIPAERVLLLEVHPAGTEEPAVILPALLLEEKLAQYQRDAANRLTFATQARDGLSSGLGILPPNTRPLVRLKAADSVVYIDPEMSGAAIAWKTALCPDILWHESRGQLDELRLFSYPAEINFTLQRVFLQEEGASAELFFRVPDPQNADTTDTTPAGLEITKTVTLSSDGKTLLSQYQFRNVSGLNRPLPIGGRLRSYPRLGGEFITDKTPLAAILKISVPTATGEYIISQGMDDRTNLFYRPGCGNDGEFSGVIRSHEYTGGEVVLTAGRDGRQSSLSFQTESAAGLLCWWTDNGPCTIEPLLENQLLAPGQSVTLTSSITIHP